MYLSIDIGSENQACTENPEYEAIKCLDKIKQSIGQGYNAGALLDTNGNKIGDWYFETCNPEGS